MKETQGRNVSELLFEEYLRENNVADWDYEPTLPGTSKRPDYRVLWTEKEYLIEVKEFQQRKPFPIGTVELDLYTAIRDKIHAAKEKFKNLKSYSCSLVIFNNVDWEVKTNPLIVFGAMRGNLGIAWDFDASGETIVDSASSNVCLGGGKMQPEQNTTINAVIVLENLQVESAFFRRELDAKWERERSMLKRDLSFAESAGIVYSHYDEFPSGGKNVPRLVVIENPFAKIKLADDIFHGPFDERWSTENGVFRRVFLGKSLCEEFVPAASQINSD